MFSLPSVDMQETFRAGMQWFWPPLHKDKSLKFLLLFVLLRREDYVSPH